MAKTKTINITMTDILLAVVIIILLLGAGCFHSYYDDSNGGTDDGVTPPAEEEPVYTCYDVEVPAGLSPSESQVFCGQMTCPTGKFCNAILIDGGTMHPDYYICGCAYHL